MKLGQAMKVEAGHREGNAPERGVRRKIKMWTLKQWAASPA